MPAEHFGPQHIPILLNHIRTAVYQEMIAARIHQHLEAAEEEGTIGTVKERAQFTNMVNSHLGLGKALKVTATAMRLTHSSSYDREKAIGSKKGPVAEVWDD